MVGIAQLNLWIFKYTSALLASLIAKDWICIVSDSCKLCEREIIYVTAGVRDVMPHLFLLSTALNRLYLSFPLFFSTHRIASLCIYTYCAHFSRMASWASSSMKYNVMFSPLPSCWHLCWSGGAGGMRIKWKVVCVGDFERSLKQLQFVSEMIMETRLLTRYLHREM